MLDDDGTELLELFTFDVAPPLCEELGHLRADMGSLAVKHKRQMS